MNNYEPTRMGNYSISLDYNPTISPDYKIGNSRGAYQDTGEGKGILTAPKVRVK